MELNNIKAETAGQHQAVINLVGRIGIALVELQEPLPGSIEYWRSHHEPDEVYDPTLI